MEVISAMRVLILLVAFAASSSSGFDICGLDFPSQGTTGNVTTPGYPIPYDTNLICNVSLETPGSDLLRLTFEAFDLREGNDFVLVVDQDGAQTWLTGNTIQKDFIGSSFEITFESDDVDNNATGFLMLYDIYTRAAVQTKEFINDVDLKPGKAAHLYSNDYPMLYDDNTFYRWNVTSSMTNVMVITIVDMDSEEQRDWLEITGYSAAGASEQLLHESGTPTEAINQIVVREYNYVIIEFRTDYSRSGRGFHIIVEPDGVLVNAPSVSEANCGNNYTLESNDVVLTLPNNTADLNCVWRVENSQANARTRVLVEEFSVEDGVDSLVVSSGLDPADWKSYRHRLTGDVSSEFFIDAGSVSLTFISGSSSFSRTVQIRISQIPDYNCSGVVDITNENPNPKISVSGFPSDLTRVYCKWLVRSQLRNNINVNVSALQTENHYDTLEIGYGANPTVVGSRLKLLTGALREQATFATYNGDLWVVFSADLGQNEGSVSMELSFTDDACRIYTILDLAGTIESPQLANGQYPNDADCQWILQVRGGFQVLLQFSEFDLEYGHDQLLIGGTVPAEDDVDSNFLILTGSELPDDVVSRYNGLNLRLKTDSSVTSSGFRLSFQEFFDCPEGYEYEPLNETCYKFVTTPTSWLEARYDCDRVADGDLVVIGTPDENDYVLNKIRSMQETNDNENWWIGYYDEAINGFWSWVDCSERNLFARNNWQDGAPDGPDDHCAYISTEDGLYNDDVCSNNRSYVCEITRKNYVDSDCYPSFFRVEIANVFEIGLAFTVSRYLCDVTGYQIRYNTSSGYKYTDLPGATNSVVLVTGLDPSTTYHFELTTCTVKYGCYGYSTALSVLGTTSGCPSGYVLGYDDGCYRFVSGSQPWVNAREDCMFGGLGNADLVNVETAAENEYLVSMVGSGRHWIGLYDAADEGYYKWSTECIEPTYENWLGNNDPKNETGDCVTFNLNGFWDDAQCDMSLDGYICEQRERNTEPDDIVPTLFRGSAVNESAVSLTWRPSDRTCDIFGYTIGVYQPGLLFDVFVPGGDSDEVTIGKLSHGSFYSFQIRTSTFSFGASLGRAVTTVKTQGCPSTYEASPDGVCYKVVSEAELTWSEAQADCRGTQGADLVTIDDEDENNYVLNITRQSAFSWIGLSDAKSDGNFTWTDCASREGNWSTPVGNDDSLDCIALNDNQYVVSNCTKGYDYVCEILEDFDPYPTEFQGYALSGFEIQLSWTMSDQSCDVTGYRVQYFTNIIRTEVQVDGGDTESVIIANLEEDAQYFFTVAPVIPGTIYAQSDAINVTTPIDCPAGYEAGFDDLCYKFSNGSLTWTEARADCRLNLNSDLVQISNSLKADFLRLRTGSALHWIGLYDVVEENDWRWGSACLQPTYDQWAPGSPRNGTSLLDCVTFNGTSSDWSDQVCSSQYQYICEIRGRVCPDGYEQGFMGQCYKFVRSAVTFDEARSDCQLSTRSDLIVIETAEEHKYIMTMGGDWWVGMYDISTEGRWRWVDCSDMNNWQSSNWELGQPDDSDGTQNCGQMTFSGGWMDWPCNRPSQYICEVDPTALVPRDPSPTNFTATPLSIVSIGLAWVPSPFNCDVIGYRIQVSQGLVGTTVDLTGGDINASVVDNLAPDSEYTFRLAALTQDEVLPYSDPIVAKTKNVTLECPDGFEQGYLGSCYRFVQSVQTWEWARFDCRKDFGGELVVIDNQFEHEYIMNRTMGGDWWIGLYDIALEGSFRWTDCSEMTPWQWSNWAPGQPDDPTGGQDCGQMISSGQWMDWPCEQPNQYICEIFGKDFVPLQANPSNFTGEPTSDSIITLTWTPSEYNCDIYGYQIRYQPDLIREVELLVSGADADMAMITDLRASTLYSFSIRAVTILDSPLDYGLPVDVATLDYTGCDTPVIITDAPGNISSPYYPGTFPPNIDCIYTITLDTRIQLAFSVLFLIPDPDDYVLISERLESEEYVPQVKLSGITLPKDYISLTRSVRIQFVSNDGIEGRGFLLTYSRYDVAPPSDKSCTSTYSLKSGPAPLLLDSPGYPNGYDNYQDCSWILEMSSAPISEDAGIEATDNLIELSFNDFSLESEYDFLVIGNGSDPSNPATQVGRYSGRNVPDVVRLDSTAAWITLETDSSNAGNVRGFSIAASEKSADQIPATKAPPPTLIPTWNGTCGGDLNVPVDGLQIARSPNYPSDYPENVECVWYLAATAGRRFRVTVEELQTEVGYDFVEIGRGSDATDSTTRYMSLSGSVDPFSIMIEEASGWIRFTSDYSSADRGFSILIEEDRNCEETKVIRPTDRTINVPSPYDNDEYCLWTVASASNQPVRAVISSFMTEDQYDFLDVGSGPLAGRLDTRVMHLSGYQNESFTTNSNTMWLAFTSDGSNNAGSFSIDFYDDMCFNQILTDLSGTITSPGYGDQYPNYASCNWVIQVTDEYNVRLTFSDFDLEEGRDTLSIRGSRADPLGSLILTGSILPDDVLSTGNNLVIQFSADSSVVGGGFSFQYEQFYDCPDGFVEVDIDGPTCYKYGTTAETWREARNDCRSTPGADLVVIENALENRYVRDISGGEEWWIGLYMRDVSNWSVVTYVECDTSILGWARYNWADGEPNRTPGNEEDCVKIIGSTGYYADDLCDLAKKYICETLKVPDVIPDAFNPTNLEGEAVSPDTIRVTWERSSYDCDVTGYALTYYIEPDEQTVVTVPDAQLIEFDLAGLTANTTYTVSISAETFSFGTLPAADTVSVRTLEAGTTNCPEDYVQGPNYSCWRFGILPATWYDARLACQAEDPDSDLAVIDSVAELNFVNDSRPVDTTMWIGLSDQGNERLFRWTDCQALDGWQRMNWAPNQPSDPLGSRDCVELTVSGEWDDQSCADMNQYVCKIQPKGFTEDDQYPSVFTVSVTSALTATAQWVPSRVSCNLLGYYLVASDGGVSDDIIVDVPGAISVRGEIAGLKPDTIYVVSLAPYTAQSMLPAMFDTMITTLNESTICPRGYQTGYNYGCYRFVADPKDWDEARMDCMQTADGDLAVVDTEDEMNYFISTGFGGYDWWIGLYDRSEEGSYRWVDCSDLSVWGQNQWDIGQPSDIDGSENCGQLQDNAKFNDRACERALPYVCEIIPKDFTAEDTNPSFFVGTSPSQDTVLLTWLPSDYNCDILGYAITYMNNGLQIVEVPGGDSNRQLIAGLEKETQYMFTLTAYTILGPTNGSIETSVTTRPSENPCEDDWIVGPEEHCYKIGKTLVTWDEARVDCTSVSDGDLVVVETAEENEFFLNTTGGNDFWIGFYDKAREGTWSWVDCPASTDFAESNWGNGQPNDLDGKQNCGQILNSGKYNDWECERTMMYICEVWPKSYVPPRANPSLFRGTADDPNTITLRWLPTVRYSCDVVAYQITYDDPRNILATTVTVEGADTSSVTLTNMLDGTLYNFTISSVLSTGPVPVSQQANVTTPSLADLCPDGWEPGYNYQCYKFSVEPVSWDEARADCKSVEGGDGDLVVMETEEEFAYIRNRTMEGDWWIGFYDKGQEGEWEWVNCERPGIWVSRNWAVGQPNDLVGSQDCGQMLSAGTWNDWGCDRPNEYICEISRKNWNVLDQNPSLLRGDALDPFTIELTWRTSGDNCDVTGYRISVVLEPDEDGYSIDVEGGETDMFLLKNLMANTAYTFDIAAITTVDILPTVGNPQTVNTPASGDCGITEFMEASGFVISPNYPDPYPDSQDCIYTITLPVATNVVELTVETLDLEPGQDFLIIGWGEAVDDNVLATLTGSTPPSQAIIANSPQVWMRFFSDESKTATGFSAAYQSLPVDEDGELTGSVTIVLVGETAETITLEDRNQFAQTLATQLNIYCSDAADNCVADMSEAEFTADNVHFTSIVEVSEGVEVTFWVSDPNDPTSNTAGLTTAQLEDVLRIYEDVLEENNGGNFDYVIRQLVSPIQEPWVIAVLCLLGLCFLLLVVVLIRDCMKSRKRKTPSLDSLEMVPQEVDAQNNDVKRESQFNENVYFSAANVKDETNSSRPPNGSTKDTPDTSTSNATPSTSSEPTYAAPMKRKSTNQKEAKEEKAKEATPKYDQSRL